MILSKKTKDLLSLTKEQTEERNSRIDPATIIYGVPVDPDDEKPVIEIKKKKRLPPTKEYDSQTKEFLNLIKKQHENKIRRIDTATIIYGAPINPDKKPVVE